MLIDLKFTMTNLNHFVAENTYTHFQQVISEAKRTAKSWVGELYFIYLPAFSRYKYNKDFHRSKIIEISPAKGANH